MPRTLSERERINQENYQASIKRAGDKKAATQRKFRIAAGLDPETGLPEVTAPAPAPLPELPSLDSAPQGEPTASTPSPLTTN